MSERIKARMNFEYCRTLCYGGVVCDERIIREKRKVLLFLLLRSFVIKVYIRF